MLEPIILDNTERLLAQSTYLGATQSDFLHIDCDGSTNSTRYFSTAGLYNGYIYNPVLDCFFGTTSDSPSPSGLIKINVNNFVPGNTTAVTSVDTSQIFDCIVNEPGATGRMWAYVKQSGANDGLWVRSTGINGTWSKAVSAASGNLQTLIIGSDDSLWYCNITAGNWYQLQNGAAGNVQITQPSVCQKYGQDFTTSNNTFQNSKWGFFDFSSYGGSAIGYLLNSGRGTSRRAMGSTPNKLTRDSSYTGSTSSRLSGLYHFNNFAMHVSNLATDSTYGYGKVGTTATPSTLVATVPYELISSAIPKGSPSSFYNGVFFQVATNYWLFVVEGSPYYTSSTTYSSQQGDGYGKRYSLALFNSGTGVIKHLGVLGYPLSFEYSASTLNIVNSNTATPTIRFGRLSGNTLELYLTGLLFSDYNGGTSQTYFSYGLMRTKISLNKLDF